MKYLLPAEGLDSINLRLNPTIQRIIIGCVEYGIRTALEQKNFKTGYLSYDFLKRMVGLYGTDEMLTKVSDFSECYLSLIRALIEIKEFCLQGKGGVDSEVPAGSVFEAMKFQDLFNLSHFVGETIKQVQNRQKFMYGEMEGFKATLDNEKSSKKDKESAQANHTKYQRKVEETKAIIQLFAKLQNN